MILNLQRVIKSHKKYFLTIIQLLSCLEKYFPWKPILSVIIIIIDNKNNNNTKIIIKNDDEKIFKIIEINKK